MKKGALLAVGIVAATIVLLIAGVVWPVSTAVAYAGGGTGTLLRGSSTPEAAVNDLATQILLRNFDKAYASLANKAEFTQAQFMRDLTGDTLSLRTYATLNNFEVQPLHQSASDAEMTMKMHWSTVVGLFNDSRDLKVVKDGDHWAVNWPLVKEQHVPPQVIPVNYLRWDVIYRGPGDDWGVQDVEAPHVRIVDMHPVQRADGVMILGELLNEDVVPAYVSVSATLLGKDQSTLASAGSFDKISHLLLPKQVTPFLVEFPDRTLAGVTGIRMTPFSTLISASADPVIEIDNEQLNPAPGASLTGQLINQSGQVVNVAHVLGTFYDKSGQVVWIADRYVDTALLPQTPVPFDIHIPEDLARRISTERTTVASFSAGGVQ